MNKFERALRDFHAAFGLAMSDVPLARVPEKTRKLRESLIEEEYKELQEALDAEDLEQICKESCDLLYVVIGLMVAYGVPIDRCFDEVHRSNMSKLGPNGRPIYREDGKALKGPDYSPADLKKILELYS